MNLMHYLLEANLYLVAFYLLYIALLRSETLYQLNRAYLLITTLIAFILPVLQLGILKPQPIPLPVITTVVPADVVSSMEPMVSAVPPPTIMAPTVPVTSPLTFSDYVLIAYGIVALVLFSFLVFKVIRLMILSKKGRSHKHIGFKIIEIPGNNVAFSFFGYLFVNTELLLSSTILRHEQVHIRQKHSWDVIYFELIKIINWFNPVVYLLQKSLKEVHEFIADQQVAMAENGPADYADFLISNAYGLWPNQITNSFFNKNLLKRRIIMLYQRPSGKAARLKYLITLPLMAGLLCTSTMAFTDKNYGFIDLDPAKPVERSADHFTKSINNGFKDTGQAFSSGPEDAVADHITSFSPIVGPSANKADAPPSFPGGDDAFYNYLKNNIDHNKTGADGAVENNVMMIFTVATNGTLYDINVHRAGADEYSDQTYDELKRVIKLSPKWIPATRNGETVNAKHFMIFNSADKNISFGRSEYIKGWKNAGLSDDAAQLFHPSQIPANTSGKILAGPADSIYNRVETFPQFPGGYTAFGEFLRNSIRYPAVDKEAKVQGRVFLQFIVEKDGSLSGLKVLRTPSETLAAEAMRVMSTSPKWTPGMNKGAAVRTMFTVPVNFSLDNSFLNGTVLSTGRAAMAADNYTMQRLGGGEQIYNAVEIQPKFSGGEAAFGKFLKDNIKYPKEAHDAGISGRVFLQFVIEKDGSISHANILRDPGKGLGEEALRVLQLSPKWDPGMQGGQAVRVQYVVPIAFDLNNNSAGLPEGRVKTMSIPLQPPTPAADGGQPIYNAVQIQPSFPGGEAGFAKFLKDNIRYPKEAHDAGLTGRVFVQFVVEMDGSLSNMKILRDPGKGLGDEAIRVLQLSPKWAPGSMNGKPVRVQFTVPINFSLSK